MGNSFLECGVAKAPRVTAVVNLENPPLPLVKNIVVGDAKKVGAGSVPEGFLAGIVR